MCETACQQGGFVVFAAERGDIAGTIWTSRPGGILRSMSDHAYFTVDQVNAAADHVIDELRDDPESVLMIPIPNGISAHQRADLLDHHGAVIAEIRRRGWHAKAHVRHTPTALVLAIDLRQ
jgi:hypothetical protein